ncbi:MAG: agmatinase [Aigarchaeota archaeon]|nr:agmatinase [Aigarchaeota archaeon]MDW8093212.1 agmatinase [Nitrososphaerota archaeon]
MTVSIYLERSKPFIGQDSGYREATYAIFGVPYDLTSSWRPGARYGPQRIREVSWMMELTPYNGEGDLTLAPFHDLGDLSVVHGLVKMCKRCMAVTSQVVRDGKVPVMMGGEHTFSLPTILACRPVKVLVLDAHLDLRESHLESRLNHATWLYRLFERTGALECAIVGARGFERSELEFAREYGVRVIKAKEVQERWREVRDDIRSFVSGGKGVYLSIDVDVLDPAFAPGVSTPEPGGIDVHTFLNLIGLVFAEAKLTGIDVVEVCPLFDNGQSSLIAAKAIVELLAASK